jgi:septal ring factor EnvC (AmiA/AmiB activator)
MNDSKSFLDKVHLQWFADDDGEDAEEGKEEEGKEDEQAVTAEQLAEVKRQLEETRKAQSGSDKRVKELQEMLKQKEREAEEAEKSAEQKAEERIAEIEKKLQQAEREKQHATQRGLAQQLLSDEGIKAPSFLDRLIGESDEETEAAVKEYIESIKQTKLSAADEFAKKNGRKVEGGKSGGPTTYEDLKGMSREEIEALPTETLDKILGNKE